MSQRAWRHSLTRSTVQLRTAEVHRHDIVLTDNIAVRQNAGCLTRSTSLDFAQCQH